MQLIVILLLVIILLLAVANAFLLLYATKVNKSIDLLLEKGKLKDSKDALFAHIEKTKELEAALYTATERIQALEKTANISFQKLGFVRFNPFGELGGSQSFVIALLDSQNNGFVISSLFIKEGNRVYAKSVVGGQSGYVLSAEEKEAIARAGEIEKPQTSNHSKKHGKKTQ